MRSSAVAYLLGVSVIGVSMGFLLPYYLIVHGYAASIGGLILAALSIIVAGGVVFILFIVGADELFKDEPLKDIVEAKKLRETLNMYRARQRAMLEDLDEIVALLKEIRDVLKAAGEA